MTARELPTGIVTFLLTDIEGSTRLLERLGGCFAHVLETHRALLTEAGKDGTSSGARATGFSSRFNQRTPQSQQL